jgi:hypothetical protein
MMRWAASTRLWHERCTLDSNGNELRHRANVGTFAYGKNVVGDWENKNLYCLDLNVYTDCGTPIKRYRSFPHMIDPEGNRRVMYKQFIANMQTGTSPAGNTSQTIIDCSFVAPDGTLLEAYTNSSDTGVTFTALTGEGEIEGDQFTAVSPGAVAYQCTTSPATPNYTLTYTATPTSYTALSANGTFIYVTGRGSQGASRIWRL